jgi:hypothetical protein
LGVSAQKINTRIRMRLIRSIWLIFHCPDVIYFVFFLFYNIFSCENGRVFTILQIYGQSRKKLLFFIFGGFYLNSGDFHSGNKKLIKFLISKYISGIYYWRFPPL